MRPWINARFSGSEEQRTQVEFTVGEHESGFVLPYGLALENDVGLAAEYWDGDSWEPLTDAGGELGAALGATEFRVNYDRNTVLGGAWEFGVADDTLVRLTYKEIASLVWAHDVDGLLPAPTEDSRRKVADPVEFQGAFGLSGIQRITPSGDVHDHDPGDNAVILIDASTPFDFTGISGGWDGRTIDLLNTNPSDPPTFKHTSTESLEGSRIVTPDGGDLLLQRGGVRLVFDATPGFWRIEAPPRLAKGARYKTGVAQSIPHNTTTIVNFGTADWDTDSEVTTGASWAYTAAGAGKRRVDAALVLEGSTNWADGERLALSLFKNGSFYANLQREDDEGAATSSFKQLQGGTVVDMAVNDTLDIRVDQLSGDAISLFNNAGYNYVTIRHIGT